MTQKSRSIFRQRRFCSQSIYYCGQTSGGMGATINCLQIKINVKMVELDQRDEPANVYAAKPNVN
jgi:HAE1 family hydrophobic/amphiphilic exporter-1